MPLFYARYFHLAPGTSAMTVGVMLLVSAPTGQWIGGILIDALHRKGIVSAAHVVQACCMLACIPFALIFCLARQLWVSEIAYVLFSAIVFAATPAGLTGWQLLTPERSRGLLIGLLLAVASLIGLGLGPAGVGMLTDHVFRDEHAMYLALLVVILAAAIAGSLSALLGMRAFALSCVLTSSAGSIDADTLGHRARA